MTQAIVSKIIIYKEFSFADDGTFTIGDVFENGHISEVVVLVTETFDGTSPTLDIQRNGQSSGEILPHNVDLTDGAGAGRQSVDFHVDGDGTVEGTLDIDSSTKGAGIIHIHYTDYVTP